VYKKSSDEQIFEYDFKSETKGLKTLLGDPKKAILKLAIPMIIAMFVQTLYNFVDALWVSGFGENLFTSAHILTTGKLALAAVGFVLPVYMILIAISTGIGLGAGSAISRKIGANNKKDADNIAIHSIIL
jgi:Na+-driven multidrug efflux pump